MATVENNQAKTLKSFLESVAPGGEITTVPDLGTGITSGGSIKFSSPDITLFCESEHCNGPRLFQDVSQPHLDVGRSKLAFVTYRCKNCTSKTKVFALWMKLASDTLGGSVFKYGEVPAFGPPTPAHLITLIGPQRDLFLKGRRSENQGLGIAAFAYYRRIVEDQKDRIFDQIIKVCNRLGTDTELVQELAAAKKETQFSKAIASIKHALPQALLVRGQNPLTLLHSALSEGMHAQTDEECLELATSIRVVLADFVERAAQALSDEAEIASAVSRLMAKKAAPIT